MLDPKARLTAEQIADHIGVTPHSDMRVYVVHAVNYAREQDTTLEAAPAPVGVRTLEWREVKGKFREEPDRCWSDCALGTYIILYRVEFIVSCEGHALGVFGELEAAKAAAQGHFDAAIRSALTHPVPVSDGAVERDGWRSMDSAPKDGTLILIRRTTQWTDDTFAVVRWDDDWWQVHDGKNDHPLRGPEPEGWCALTLPAVLKSQTGGDHA